MSPQRLDLLRRLLLERLSLRAIVRVVGVSRSWLQQFVNTLYAQTPWEPGALKKKAGQVRIAVDELWSFIGCKAQPWWVWLAQDSRTRQVVGMAVGDRDEFSGRCRYESLPSAYQQRTIVATDLLAVYQSIVPEDGHATGGKEMGLTNHVERFFGTLRQRCARVVRKTLSFSRKMENHVGACGTSSDTTTYAAHKATTKKWKGHDDPPIYVIIPCNRSPLLNLAQLPTGASARLGRHATARSRVS